jgi:hypothetical protein
LFFLKLKPKIAMSRESSARSSIHSAIHSSILQWIRQTIERLQAERNAQIILDVLYEERDLTLCHFLADVGSLNRPLESGFDQEAFWTELKKLAQAQLHLQFSDADNKYLRGSRLDREIDNFLNYKGNRDSLVLTSRLSDGDGSRLSDGHC